MIRKVFREGGVWFAGGLLCTSINSLLDRLAGTAHAIDFARGFFDGLAVGASGAAIYFLVQRARSSSDREQKGYGQ